MRAAFKRKTKKLKGKIIYKSEGYKEKRPLNVFISHQLIWISISQVLACCHHLGQGREEWLGLGMRDPHIHLNPTTGTIWSSFGILCRLRVVGPFEHKIHQKRTYGVKQPGFPKPQWGLLTSQTAGVKVLCEKYGLDVLLEGLSWDDFRISVLCFGGRFDPFVTISWMISGSQSCVLGGRFDPFVTT